MIVFGVYNTICGDYKASEEKTLHIDDVELFKCLRLGNVMI